MRALHEKEALLLRIAALDRSAGDGPHAIKTEHEAGRISEQAKLLHKLLDQG